MSTEGMERTRKVIKYGVINGRPSMYVVLQKKRGRKPKPVLDLRTGEIYRDAQAAGEKLGVIDRVIRRLIRRVNGPVVYYTGIPREEILAQRERWRIRRKNIPHDSKAAGGENSVKPVPQ